MRPIKDSNNPRKKREPVKESKQPIERARRNARSKPIEKSEKTKNINPEEGIRLNRYIANAGICSRRDADMHIQTGSVSINGKVVTQLGTKVKPIDSVRFDGRLITPEKKTYIVLNKPKDFVTTLEDQHAKKIVTDLIKEGCKERVYPVGRLDKQTTGVLLLTNDGELTDFLTHPKNNKKKIYQVTLDKPVTQADLQLLYDGVELDDGPAKADEISYCNPGDKREIGIEIHSGKNRVVRRMFEHLGYRVNKLDRVYFAGLTKKNLTRGKWRFLTETEVAMLKRGAFK